MNVKNISLEQPTELPFLVKENKSGTIYLVTKGIKDKLVFTILSNDYSDYHSLIIDDVDFNNLSHYLSNYEILPKGTIVELLN
jgi:hypothetical protein